MVNSIEISVKKIENEGYDARPYPFDWRRSIEEETTRLARDLDRMLNRVTGHPISIAAHSMGGLVARQLMIDHPQLWKRLNERTGFKMIFLGCPLGGSYLIPEVLVGAGKRIKQMALLDISSNKEELLKVFSEYSGIIDLLPIHEGSHDFEKRSVWKEIYPASNKVEWTIPTNEELARFGRFKQKVKSWDSSMYSNPNVYYIAGKADTTAESYKIDDYRPEGNQLVFTTTNRGDGSVTWDSGIPKELKDEGRVYYVNVKHGALLKEKDIFDGIVRLIKTGSAPFSQEEIKSAKRGLPSGVRDEILLPSNGVQFGSSFHGRRL